MPSGSARVRITSIVCGQHVGVDDEARRRPLPSRRAAPASSPRRRRWPRRAARRSAIARPVRSATIVWKLSSASSRPCEISGWYGVYAVYQAGFSRTLRRITGRRDGAVVAQADHRRRDRVAGGERAQLGEHLALAPGGRQVQRLVAADARRDGRRDELLERGVADGGEHRADVVGVGPDVPVREDDGRVPVPAAAVRPSAGPSPAGRSPAGASRRDVMRAPAGVRVPRPGTDVGGPPGRLPLCRAPSRGGVTRSRAASLTRSWRLRGSGESCPFGARHRPCGGSWWSSVVRGGPGLSRARSTAPAKLPAPAGAGPPRPWARGVVDRSARR